MFTSPKLYQELIVSSQYSRRLLLNGLLHPTPPPGNKPVDPTDPYSVPNGFDANVIMVLSVLLCALICSLGLNFIIKCALRCSSFGATESDDPAARLANTGIKKKALKSFAVVSYSGDLKLPGVDTECVICLSEFVVGDKLRLLPRCNHGFHADCIDRWLNRHSSCPTCRHCLIDTCQKIVASSSQPELPQESVIDITPLDREDLVRNYRCGDS